MPSSDIAASPQTVDSPAGLRRRLAAMVYDTFLIIALLILLSVPIVLINGGPVRDGSSAGEIKNIFYLAYLVLGVFIFYGWFWTHGGQTLGMKTWKIRIISLSSQPLTWRQAAIRFISAGLGLTNITAKFSHNGLAWHEHLSQTRTIHLKQKR